MTGPSWWPDNAGLRAGMRDYLDACGPGTVKTEWFDIDLPWGHATQWR